jgi:hypothetical protein
VGSNPATATSVKSPHLKGQSPQERTLLQNLTPDTLLPATSAECGPDPAARRGAARYPLAGSQRRYRVCWLAGGDTIVPWNDTGVAA